MRDLYIFNKKICYNIMGSKGREKETIGLRDFLSRKVVRKR